MATSDSAVPADRGGACSQQGAITFHEVERESPCFEGHEFGDVGAYEWIRGRVHGRVDPGHPLNRGIALIDLAPRDAQGGVAWAADLSILKPVDPSRGNGWLLHDVANRGHQRALQCLNCAPASNRPRRLAHAGLGHLLRRGFSIACSGWQGDVVPGDDRLCIELPIATQDKLPVTGIAREEFILDARDERREDGIVEITAGCFRARLSHPAADTAEPAVLTLRARARDARQSPAGLHWRYIDARTVEITHPPHGPFDRGAIFEFVYRARDPRVMGLGLAAIRDVVAFLRHGGDGDRGDPNPLQGRIRHTMGFGLSQGGRVLREFLHEGFNQDLQGRAVFDAALPLLAGSRRAFLNQAFSQPGRFSRQHEDHDCPGDQFPFSYGLQHDPVSGRSGGILQRAQQAGVSPKLLHLDTDTEYFSARASLVVTDGQGRDIDLPDEVRVYLASSVAHVADPVCDEVASAPGNPLGFGSLARALADALVAWVERGTLPPASGHPTRASGTLWPLDELQRRFPRIPGAAAPAQVNELQVADPAVVPPVQGPHYPVFVPAVDADGNGIAGVPHPWTLAPIGTHTGWQLRRAGYAGGELFSVFGSFWPFPATDAQAREAGDARPSMQARYGAPRHWCEQLAAAMRPMVDRRLLLQEDHDRLLAQARRLVAAAEALPEAPWAPVIAAVGAGELG